MRYRLGVALGVLLALSTTGYADTVMGKVVGPDGRPVAGVEVFIAQLRDTMTARTGATGAFSFDLEAPRGRRQFYAYATAYKDGLSLGGTALQAGDNLIRLGAPGTIRGQVQDGEGKPVAGAVVQVGELRNAYGGDGRTTPDGSITGYIAVPRVLRERLLVRTDAAGTWAIRYLPRSGQAVVMVKDTRYMTARANVSLDGTALDTPPLLAIMGTSVAGHVRYEDGRPAAGMRVFVNYHESVSIKAGRRVFASSADDFVLTKDDGSYRIVSLPPGAVTVQVEDPSGQTVAAPLTDIKTYEGVIATANDFTLGPGGFVEGTVADKETGQPMPDLPVNIWYGKRDQSIFPTPTTDAQGHFRVRVAPGTTLLDVVELPRGYLRSGRATEVTVGQGETKTVALQIAPGLKVGGVVLGEDGKPVPGLRITLMPLRSGTMITADTDNAGRWSAQGLAAGESRIQIRAEDGGELVAPKTLTLPATEPVTITVKRLDLLPLQGRVVTNQGTPIPDLGIMLRTTVKLGQNGTSSSSRQIRTGADGRLEITRVRADGQVSISHAFSGYHYVSGGVVEKQDGAFTMSDLVLAPLTAEVSGIVLDEAGQPVAGATVIARENDSGAEAHTDDQGKFTLYELPAGQEAVTLLVAQAGRYAELRTNHAAPGVEVRLAGAPALPGTDVARGFEVLKKLWEAGPQGVYERDPKLYAALRELWPGTGGRFYRYSIPQLLAADYPDLAWKLLSEGGDTSRDGALAQIITTLAAHDPVRAAAWALPKLNLFEDPANAFNPRLALALAIVDIEPAKARELYRQSGDFVRAHPDDDIITANEKPAAFAKLALIAARLEPGAVKDWSDQSLSQFKRTNRRDPSIIATLIAANPAAVDTLLEPLEPHSRSSALADAGPLLARWNLAEATPILDRLQLAETTTSQSTFIVALIRTIYAVGPAHPAEASALATRVTDTSYRAQALLAAVQFQPAEKLPSLVRQLTALAGQSHSSMSFSGNGISFDGSDSRMPARLAALAYDGDPEYGKQLFAAEKEKLQGMRYRGEADRGWPQGRPLSAAGDIAAFAYYYRRVDPGESRLMLERAFADASRRASGGGTEQFPFDRPYARELGDIVIAMAALDTTRALDMAATLKTEDRPLGMRYGPSLQAVVLSKIGEYLLAPEDVRGARPFKPGAGDNY